MVDEIRELLPAVGLSVLVSTTTKPLILAPPRATHHRGGPSNRFILREMVHRQGAFAALIKPLPYPARRTPAAGDTRLTHGTAHITQTEVGAGSPGVLRWPQPKPNSQTLETALQQLLPVVPHLLRFWRILQEPLLDVRVHLLRPIVQPTPIKEGNGHNVPPHR